MRSLVVGSLLAAFACARGAPEPVGPPTKAQMQCDQASDCQVWPSGCCEWRAINRSYRGPPGPGAGCEMECPREPTGVACQERACILLWPGDPPGGPTLEHPSR